MSREGGWTDSDPELPIDGIGGVTFGINHSGLDITSWSSCAGGGQAFTNGWPASGSGIAVTWESGCHHPPGDAVGVGFFAVADGAAGAIEFTNIPLGGGEFPDDALFQGIRYVSCPPIPEFAICQGNTGVANLAVGTRPTCGNRCAAGTPVEGSTWGSIKRVYR